MGQERETGNTEVLVLFGGKVCVCEHTAVLHPVHRAVLGSRGSAVGVERGCRVWLEQTLELVVSTPCLNLCLPRGWEMLGSSPAARQRLCPGQAGQQELRPGSGSQPCPWLRLCWERRVLGLGIFWQQKWGVSLCFIVASKNAVCLCFGEPQGLCFSPGLSYSSAEPSWSVSQFCPLGPRDGPDWFLLPAA